MQCGSGVGSFHNVMLGIEGHRATSQEGTVK